MFISKNYNKFWMARTTISHFIMPKHNVNNVVTSTIINKGTKYKEYINI